MSCIRGQNYIFKYFHENSDRLTVQLVGAEQHFNETGHFQDTCYLLSLGLQNQVKTKNSRLLGHVIESWGLTCISKIHCTVHFPDEHQNIAVHRSSATPKITERFMVNCKLSVAAHIKYHYIPQYFSLNKGNKAWTLRAKSHNLEGAAGSTRDENKPQLDFIRSEEVFRLSPLQG